MPVRGHKRPNTGKDDDDKDDIVIQWSIYSKQRSLKFHITC
jgi:hypothetical protein